LQGELAAAIPVDESVGLSLCDIVSVYTDIINML